MKTQPLVNSVHAFLFLLFAITSPAVAQTDDPYEDNDDCASATHLAGGVIVYAATSYSNLFVSKTDKDHFKFCVSPGETTHCLAVFAHADANINMILRAANSPECGSGSGANELASGVTLTNNEKFNWTNNSGAPLEVVLEISIPSNSMGDSAIYSLSVSGASNDCYEVGSTFCDPATDNCSGRPTRIYGVPVTSGAGVLLLGEDGPSAEFGYFLVSESFSSPGIVLSRGNFCLLGGAPFGRYNVSYPGSQINSLGSFNNIGSIFGNLSNTGYPGGFGFIVPVEVPIGGTSPITAGDTWNFQLWHRDSACDVPGSSNFSNGLSISF